MTQTGVWTLTAINDYLQGNIKKHELTVKRLERLIAKHLQHTHLDANPILITYPEDKTIEAITERYTHKECLLDFINLQSRHQVWAITDADDLNMMIKAFKNIPVVYIADGHHRLASMARLKNNPYFSTVYMNTKEIKVLEFNRLVKGLAGLSPSAFLDKIKVSFDVEEKKTIVKPEKLHEIGLYFNHKWYKLQPKKRIYDANDPVEVLEVHILQDFILGPVLSVVDPRTDARISFLEGRIPVHELQIQVDKGLYDVAFTLFPVSVAQIIAVADANRIMPPKSTWIEPKFLVGLLTRYLE